MGAFGLGGGGGHDGPACGNRAAGRSSLRLHTLHRPLRHAPGGQSISDRQPSDAARLAVVYGVDFAGFAVRPWLMGDWHPVALDGL